MSAWPPEVCIPPISSNRCCEAHGFGKRDLKIKRYGGRTIRAPAKPFALCIDNTGYRASLILGKVYRILPNSRAARDDLVRIVNESGEDYLYHKDHSVFVDFPPAVKKKILALEHAV